MTNEVVDFTSQKASEQVQEKKTSQTEMLTSTGSAGRYDCGKEISTKSGNSI